MVSPPPHRPDEMPVPYDVATVSDAMSRGVISVPPETPLRVVARMMATFHVHAIFVFEHVDEDDEASRLWAVVSDLDLVAVAADRPMAEAASLMAQHGIAHLAVTDPETRRPIGVISTLDIAQAVAAGLDPGETFPSA